MAPGLSTGLLRGRNGEGRCLAHGSVGFTIHWRFHRAGTSPLWRRSSWLPRNVDRLVWQPDVRFQGWTYERSPDLLIKRMVCTDPRGLAIWQHLMAITLLEFSKFTGELRDADILVNNDQKTFDSFCDLRVSTTTRRTFLPMNSVTLWA